MYRDILRYCGPEYFSKQCQLKIFATYISFLLLLGEEEKPRLGDKTCSTLAGLIMRVPSARSPPWEERGEQKSRFSNYVIRAQGLSCKANLPYLRMSFLFAHFPSCRSGMHFVNTVVPVPISDVLYRKHCSHFASRNFRPLFLICIRAVFK